MNDSGALTNTAPGEAVAQTRRPRRRLLFAAAFVVGLAAVLASSGAGLAAWDASYEARVLPGVHVGDVDLSGLDRPAAAAALATALAYDQGKLVLRTPDGDIAIPYSAFGRRAEIDALVDEALRRGRAGGVVDRAIGEVRQALNGTTIPPRLVLDEAALSDAITAAWSRSSGRRSMRRYPSRPRGPSPPQPSRVAPPIRDRWSRLPSRPHPPSTHPRRWWSRSR